MQIKKDLGKVTAYEEIDGDHMTFMVAEDASYFSERAMSIIRAAHPATTDWRQGSTFAD